MPLTAENFIYHAESPKTACCSGCASLRVAWSRICNGRTTRHYCARCCVIVVVASMKMDEWDGRTVTFRENTETRGGTKFLAGEEAIVTSHHRGSLSLRTADRRGISKMSKFSVMLPELQVFYDAVPAARF